MRLARKGWLAVLALCACSCGSGSGGATPGLDGAVDGASGDTGTVMEGSPSNDGGASDASDATARSDDAGSDAGSKDASVGDASSADASTDAPPGDANVLDPTFADGGLLTVRGDPDAGSGQTDLMVVALATRPDGRILVLFEGYNRQIWIAQLLADGSAFDPAFAGGGLLAIPNTVYGGDYFGRPALALTSGGEVIAAYGCAGSNPWATYSDSCIARLTSAGQLDSTWGTNGIVDESTWGMFTAAAVDSNGSVWLAGGNYTTLDVATSGVIVGLGSTGVPDLGPQSNGNLYANAQGGCVGVGVQSGGRVVAACSDQNGGFDLFGFTFDGMADPSFPMTKVVIPQTTAVAMAMYPDDSMLVVGTQTLTTTTKQLVAARFTAGGVLQTSFGDAGTLSYGVSALTWLAGVARRAGNAYVAGTVTTDASTNQVAIVKLGAGGVDPSYGAAGLGLLPSSWNARAFAVAAQDAGIVVGGMWTGAAADWSFLARATP